jgi:hypothetical protein
MPRTKNLPKAHYSIQIKVTPPSGDILFLSWEDVGALVGPRALTSKAFGEAVQHILNTWQTSINESVAEATKTASGGVL